MVYRLRWLKPVALLALHPPAFQLPLPLLRLLVLLLPWLQLLQ